MDSRANDVLGGSGRVVVGGRLTVACWVGSGRGWCASGVVTRRGYTSPARTSAGLLEGLLPVMSVGVGVFGSVCATVTLVELGTPFFNLLAECSEFG